MFTKTPLNNNNSVEKLEIKKQQNQNLNKSDNLKFDNDENENNVECTAERLDECRLAMIGIRGSYLEAPCYCDSMNQSCMEKQNIILPNNPCIGMFFDYLLVKYFIW